MRHPFVCLLLLLNATVALAQAPENTFPTAPGAASIPSGAGGTTSSPLGGSGSQDPLIHGGEIGSSAGTLDTHSLGSAAPREIFTPSTTSPPGGPVSLASVEARFAQLDRNHNGSLSMEEMNAIPASAASASSATRFDRMDTNHDGKISAAEYSAAQAAMIQSATGSPPSSSSNVPTTAALTGTASPSAPPASQQ